MVPGRYRLEVSTPGIGRPWKRIRDFERNIGSRVSIRLFSPLADGRRRLKGTLAGLDGEKILLDTEDGHRLEIPLSGISRAKPDIDWDQLLRKKKKPTPAGEPQGGKP